MTTSVRSSFECRALPRALAVVELPDEVAAVHLEIVAGRGHDRVVLDWRADGSSCGEVTGRNRTWVVGVHGVVQRFLDERGYAAPAPPRRRSATADPIRHRVTAGWGGGTSGRG